MQKRERIERALNYDSPDRVPIEDRLKSACRDETKID